MGSIISACLAFRGQPSIFYPRATMERQGDRWKGGIPDSADKERPIFGPSVGPHPDQRPKQAWTMAARNPFVRCTLLVGTAAIVALIGCRQFMGSKTARGKASEAQWFQAELEPVPTRAAPAALDLPAAVCPGDKSI